MTMIRTLAAAALTTALLATGVSTADAATDQVRPCKYEDGSSQARCVWDARHMGNGQGQSLLITEGGTDDARYIDISHKRAHRLFTEVQN